MTPCALARRYADAAEAAGRIAIFVSVHAIEVHEAYIENGENRFPRPTVKLSVCTARLFADHVDEAPAEYAREAYKIGERKGILRSPDGCVHPTYATDYPDFDTFIEQVLVVHGRTGSPR